MKKSPDAFRTISEVSEWLETPAHVLRFWESRFSQVKPVKRAGGRRYYRPSDMLLLGGIKRLLHEDGMTIRGAQKILREQGVKHVADLSQPVEGGADIELTAIEIADSADAPPPPDPASAPAPEPDLAAPPEAPMAIDVPTDPAPEAPPERDNVVALDSAAPQPDLPLPATDIAPDTPPAPAAEQPPAPVPALDPSPEPTPEPTAEPRDPVAAAPSENLPETVAPTEAADLPPPPEPAETTAAEDMPQEPAPAVEDIPAAIQPLGAALARSDPDDDDDSFVRHMPPPLTIQLRDRVVRLKLNQQHRQALDTAVTRLDALRDRMSDRKPG